MTDMGEDGKLADEAEEFAANVNTTNVILEQIEYKPSRSMSLNIGEDDKLADRPE